MDIDQFKNLWNEDNNGHLPEISLKNKQSLSSPLQKIRKNMKMEFLSTLVILPIGIGLIFYSIQPSLLQFYALMLLFVGCVIVGYYYLKFYQLYHRLNSLDWNTTHSLLQMKHDLELNIELYKSYYLAFIPILFSELILVFYHHSLNTKFNLEFLIVQFVFWFLILCISLYFTGKAWLYYFYEKYILQINQQIDELITESGNSAIASKTTASFAFLQRYFPITIAYLMHLFLWFWICILGLILVFVLINLFLCKV